uniref:Ig-like domain-containing protein n=1 Tax=Mastacembelus armatus TaxID=205130 RepID=A0A7N8WUY5_9TELE
MRRFQADFKGFTCRFGLWTSVLWLGFVFWPCAEGEIQVIGPAQPIIAAPGDDIVLPCHVEPQINVEGQPVEWLKPDLQLSRFRYVYLYRDRREVRAVQIPSYVRRTALFTNELRRGNVSLRILNVTLADEGRYRCFLPTLAGHRKDSVVQLVVDPNLAKNPPTIKPQLNTNLQTPDPEDTTVVKSVLRHLGIWVSVLVVFIVLLLSIAGGYLLRHQFLRHSLKYDPAPPAPA